MHKVQQSMLCVSLQVEKLILHILNIYTKFDSDNVQWRQYTIFFFFLIVYHILSHILIIFFL